MNDTFTVEIAGIVIGIQHRYEYVKMLCRDYITDRKPDFVVSAEDSEIDRELRDGGVCAPRSYAEATCLHRQIACRLSEYDAFLLHSAVISCEGRGYAFAARSGVGKSTHIALWKKNFGDRVQIVNGDKPIVRMKNGLFYAYGTPWRGKEGQGLNISCPLNAICFLERGKENRIRAAEKEEILSRLFLQVFLPPDATGAVKTLELIDTLIRKTDFYVLSCNMEKEAADVAYIGMTNNLQKGNQK